MTKSTSEDWSAKRWQPRVTLEMEALIEAEAAERGCSPASVIRDAVSDYFGLARIASFPREQHLTKSSFWKQYRPPNKEG